MEFMNLLEQRRSIHQLAPAPSVTAAAVEALVGHAVLHTPSAFDAQSQRAVLLFGESHRRFWDLVLAALKPLVPPADFPKSEAKVRGFAEGMGTVLFFDDAAVTRDLEERFPLYRKNFGVWASQQLGILENNVWLGLAEIGLGASLQHYAELVEDATKAAFGLPSTWRLDAQMPFGVAKVAPRPKTFRPLTERLLVRS